jgi:hypothetical protein
VSVPILSRFGLMTLYWDCNLASSAGNSRYPYHSQGASLLNHVSFHSSLADAVGRVLDHRLPKHSQGSGA